MGLDWKQFPQIHGRAFHRLCYAKGDTFCIAGCIRMGKQQNVLIHCAATIMTCQIEIAVAGQAAEGIRIGNR